MNRPHIKAPSWLVVLGGLIVFSGLYSISLSNYLLFHGLVEMFCVVVACGIFILAWNTRTIEPNSYLLLLGIAYLFIGGLDLIHTLAYKGMGIFPGLGADPPTQLWIGARYLEAVSLAAAPLAINRRLNPWLVLGGYAAIAGLILASIFTWNLFPACYIDGLGLTPFKINSEYVISGLLVLAIIHTLLRRDHFNPAVLRPVILALMATIIAEMAFTFYVSVYGLSNLVGHIFKLISFLLIYQAIVVTGLRDPYRLLFRKLKQREEALEAMGVELENRVARRTDELSRTNERLLREIAERERAETARLEADEKYRLLVESARDGIVIVQDGQVCFANTAATAITGYSRQELTGMPVSRLIHPDDRGEVFLAEGAIRNNGPTFKTVAHRLIDSSGQSRQVETGMASLLWDGQPAMLVILNDVTEMRNLERQVVISQKMEALGNLAGGITHDFNNILSAINGYAEMAGMEINDPAKTSGYIDHILAAGERAKILVSRIMSFSRASEDLTAEPVVVREVVAEALGLVRAALPANIDIIQEIDDDPDWVLGDPTRIHQVVMNLATNAAQAMADEGGQLRIRLERLEADEEFAEFHVRIKPGPYLRMTVSDTGQGMDRQTAERIFEPFFTTKAKGKGTGLGLAVTHRIITDMSGCVTVYSEPGQGTTFNIYLPLMEHRTARVAAAPDAEPLTTGAGRLLVVDDEPMLAELGGQTLERLGYQVTVCTDPQQAWDVFRSAPDQFDLLFTDYNMPGYSGVELAGRMLEIRPDLPVVLCTGAGEALNPVVTGQVRIAGQVMKPVPMNTLSRVIRDALDRSG